MGHVPPTPQDWLPPKPPPASVGGHCSHASPHLPHCQCSWQCLWVVFAHCHQHRWWHLCAVSAHCLPLLTLTPAAVEGPRSLLTAIVPHQSREAAVNHVTGKEGIRRKLSSNSSYRKQSLIQGTFSIENQM